MPIYWQRFFKIGKMIEFNLSLESLRLNNSVIRIAFRIKKEFNIVYKVYSLFINQKILVIIYN